MSKNLKNCFLALALASVPVTLYGLVDTFFQISNYGTIGGSPIFSGSCSNNLAVGFNNLFNNTYYSAAIGQNLQNYTANSTVVGKYNTPTSNALFIVGNGPGTGSTPRTNAFEVLGNGAVNVPIKPIGGITPKLTIGDSSTTGTAVTAKIHGTADIDRVPRKGGISMGSFLAQ